MIGTGQSVLRVCRGVLAHVDDAEDAFQATFLVLVRKAPTLWVRDSLGPWLHQVAFRTASCARSAKARRKKHESAAANMRESILVSEHAATVSDWEPTLHEEISRLPERYRAPVVLCDLQSRSHEQAARSLGWPVGTVKSRLARARERLRSRLARRGWDGNAAPIALALKGAELALPVPTVLRDSTIHSAIEFLLTRKIVPGFVSFLTREVLNSMATTAVEAAGDDARVGATVSGAGYVGTLNASGRDLVKREKVAVPSKDDPAVVQVKPAKFTVNVAERGFLEPSQSERVWSQVEGTTTIIFIKPEGSKVKKGELVCELDSAPLRDKLTIQEIAAQRRQVNGNKQKSFAKQPISP